MPNSSDELTEHSIYHDLTRTYFEKWAHEKFQSTKEACIRIQKLYTTFTKFHEHQALMLLAPEYAQLCGYEYDENEWSVEDVIGCGIILIQDKKFVFSHPTFAEYFVAVFAVQLLEKYLTSKTLNDEAKSSLWSKLFSNLAKPKSETAKFMEKVIGNKKLQVVRIFMDGALVENGRLEMIEAATEKDSKAVKKIKEMSKNLSAEDLIFGRFENINNLKNLTKFISLRFKKGSYKKVKTIFYKIIHKKIKKLSSSAHFWDQDNSKIFNEIAELLKKVATSFMDVEVFEYLILKIKKNHGFKLTKRIFNEKLKCFNICHLNVIQFLALTTGYTTENFDKYFKSFAKIFSTFEIMSIMNGTDDDNENIFHVCVKEMKCKKYLELIWRGNENFVNSRNSQEMFRQLVMQKNKQHQTILHQAAKYCLNIDIYKTFWELLLKTFGNYRSELWNFMKQTDKSKQTFVHDLMSHSKTEIIDFTLIIINDEFGSEKLIDILTNCGENILHYAVCESSSEKLELLVNKLQELMSHDYMRRMLSTLSCECRNLLQSATKFNKSLTIHKCLWDCYKKYFSSFEIMKFIKHSGNYYKYNILHYAVHCSTKDIVEFTWNQMKSFMDENERVEYLELRGNFDRDLLEIARMNYRNKDVKHLVSDMMRDCGCLKTIYLKNQNELQ